MRYVLLAVVSLAFTACVVRDEVGHNAPEDFEVGPMPRGRIAVTPHAFRGEEYGSLGVANAIVGDIDGDGFDDFVMVDREGAGTTYLFYGGTSFQEEASVLEADAILESGWEFVRGVGDLDGDGLDDFAFVGGGAGIGYLVYGSRDRLSGRLDAASVSTAFVTPAEYRGEMFGIKAAGDVNGDGYGDLLIEVRSGSLVSIYLVHAGPEHLPVTYSLENADATFRGEHDGYRFGLGSAAAGDVNGDGYSDLLLSTYSQEHGRIGLFYGGAGNVAGAMSPGDAQAGFDMPSLWATMGPVGDLDGDGIEDLAIASDRSIPVFYGKKEKYTGNHRALDAAFSIAPENTPAYLAGLATGDVDGDGNIDLLIGDPHQSRNGVQAGALYLVLGANHRFDVQHELSESNALLYGKNLQASGIGLGEDLGYGVASGGDINGDGYDDILAGAPGDAVGDVDGGSVYLFLGGPRIKDDSGAID